MGQVYFEVVEKTGVAGAFEADMTVVADNGDWLLLDGGEVGRKLFEVLNALVFGVGDAEAFVVGKRSSALTAIVEKPFFVGGDGIVEADEDGLEIGGKVGFGEVVSEVGMGEDGVDEMKGFGERGVGLGEVAGGGLGAVGDGIGRVGSDRGSRVGLVGSCRVGLDGGCGAGLGNGPDGKKEYDDSQEVLHDGKEFDSFGK